MNNSGIAIASGGLRLLRLSYTTENCILNHHVAIKYVATSLLYAPSPR